MHTSRTAESAREEIMSVKEKDYDFWFKILLIGDSGVGAKTTLLNRFVNDRFDTSLIATIGIDFKCKMVDIDGARLKLQIWDTAGQERFRTITSAYYRGSHVFVLGYDITDEESFANIKMWKAHVEQYAPPDVHKNFVLVGNKCDLNEKRKVTSDQGKEFADENGWPFFETSAKENINVTETFLAAARIGLRQVQFGSSVRCRKFDSAAVLGPRWEVVWAKLHPSMLALGKTKEQSLDSKSASTFAMSGSKCEILDEYKGSRHILVITPASHKTFQELSLYLSFDDSGARDTFSSGIRWGIAVQKYERLLSAAPSSKYDCSGMRSPWRLLSVIKRASAQDSSAVVETLSIANNNLRPQDVAELMVELHKFPALSRLDVSANPELGDIGVVAVMSSLSGTRISLPWVVCTHAPVGSKSHLLTSFNLSGTGLTLEAAPMMLEQLYKFSELKNLDISHNHRLRLLSVGMLQYATCLYTLACDGFSQNLFSTPGENPGRIRQLFETPPDAMVQVATDWEVNLAAAELTPAMAQEAANVLRLCPSLNRLDLSANVKLGSGGVCDILSSLKGTRLDSHLFHLSVKRSPGTQASSLRHLSLSRTSLQVEGVSKLAEQLKRFPKLRVLDLSGNPGLDRVSVSLFIDALQATRELVELDLSGSSVAMLPENIGRSLPKLEKLIFDDCNGLNSLPVALGSLKDLKHISVKRCAALVYPPRSQQLDPIKTAKFMMSAYSNSEHWRRVKVAFLGNGRSGKTSLLRTLAKLPLQTDERSTTGITVDAFAAELQPSVFDRARHGWDLELSWWDFAGQLEYSAAHEFFMSSRQALYVVVFSVLDEDEVIMQQLLHWFSVVPALAVCPHVRLMVVGTKIDQILSSELQSVLKIKSKIVHHILDIMGLAERVLPSDILFVSASLAFDCPEQKLSWKLCRRGLKDRIYHNCVSILDGDNSDVLRYPKQCKQMRQLVSQLHKELKKKQQELPCCRLDHEDAVKVLGSLLEETDLWGQRKSSLETKDRKLYFKTDLVALALDILNDLGVIVLYGGQGLRTSLASAQSEPSICVEPQFLPAIMSLLVDPQTKLPAVVTSDALLDLLQTNPKVSRISRESSPELKAQLLELLESVGIVRRHGSSQNFLVPLALRGRPVHWSQIVRAGCSEYFVLGQRLGISHTARITSSCFTSVMLNKCVDVERMWGSAFAYDVKHEAGNVAGCVFVRLAEDRRSVDVVALIDVAVDIDWQVVTQREVDSIAQLLGYNVNDANGRMYLCPMCCSANMFVHSGAAHAFYLQEVSSGVALHCSRYHDATNSSLTEGKVVKLDLNGTPLLHPSRIQELQLPWKLAAAGGITVPQMCSAPVSEADSNQGYYRGTFLDTSFFVLTGQVAAGAVLQSDDLLRFESLIASCNDQCAPFPPFSDRFVLKDSFEVQLQFRFNIGDIPALPGGRKILSIHASDVGDALDTTPSMSSFSCMDNVLVIFEKIVGEKKRQFVLFPGKRHDLLLCRLTPAYCSINTQAACCWSELQDYFAIVMGPEFQNYEITALTVFRNDDRAHAFVQQMHSMTWCERDAMPPWQNRGRIAADAIAALLGDACASYREKFEREFDWLHCRTMEDDELKHEIQQKYRVDTAHTDEVVAVIRQLLYTFDAQDATMHHFADHAGKFGLVPPEENVDVNLILGWWGHWKGNAVYESLAQNGFTNIPKQLKIDEGYYGKGFYFTRFPRYSDYYNCGFSLATREVEGTFLMSFTLMGRPYPVTQHPFPKPATHQRALHAQANALDNGLLGRSCEEQPYRCCGADSHDSHYVTVRKKGEYYPCPPREQPDFDEVVVFNPTNVLPAASFEFKRRRRTLLWLDDHPDGNMAVLKQFPGCPQHKSLLHQPVYPMRPHCDKCGHGLSMDSNPFATCKERRKTAEAAKQAYTAAVIAAEDTPSDEATRKEAECKRAIDEANKLVEEAEAVADAMHEALKGRDIKLEEQVDVVMFLRVEELTNFMSKHPELSNYPTSLLRIISSHSLFFGDTAKGATGLLHFLDSEPAWRFKFPATFVFYKYSAADFSAAMGRPNFFKSREPNHCSAFALFKPLALMPK